MSNIRWWSQPFPPEGGVTGSGVMRQLGTPSMELLDVLVRESAQNSWDAAIGDQIRYSIEFRRLGEHADAWRRLIGDSDSTDGTVVHPGDLTPDTLILIIGDRGTSGLGGPLLADEKVKPGHVANFVQFLRNVGEPRDKDLGGGTYGFGKAIFYNLSACGAILVDTHCTDRVNRRRLMGAALGDPFSGTDGVRYTGRHWWGATDDSRGVPLPLLEDEAAAMSRQFGLPGFDDGETGTDVAILMPNLGLAEGEEESRHDNIDEAADRVVSAILWHLWPKLGSAGRRPEIKVSVVADGRPVPIQRPDQYPFLRPFTLSLDAIEADKGSTIVRKTKKFPGEVGKWAIHFCQADPTSGSNAGLLSAKPFTSPYHHVARMRQAKLVVDYLECEPYPGQDMGYGAAFIASPDFDQCFADAEPPTHDKWETRGLPDKARLVVNHATTNLRKGIKELLASRASSRSSDLAGLGRLSSNLARLIPFDGREANPATPKKTQATRAGGKRGPTAKVIGPPRLVREGSELKMIAEVRPPDVGHRQVTLIADPYVVLDDGRRENDAPINAPTPTIIGWRDEEGNVLSDGSALSVTGDVSRNETLTVVISRVANASIGLSVETKEE
ncbi:hypothetical protein ACFORJ_00455 [Corynebacterium hansenii]|uniref:Uncharacterized protein n=1 Tax=Corynebacterium hansenii TaxID=394964 RepID=A0ABV7ZMK8_9CORY|nr:hypothetical protein [Corynebacterium hansenii]WJY99529.1 hypothetical protein CHAN_04530 [Corynebacterium hansenii]